MNTFSDTARGCLKITFLALVTIAIVSLAFAAGFGTGVALGPRLGHPPTPPVSATPTTEEEEAFRVFWEAWHILERDFYGELPDPQEMTYGAIRGVLNTLDDPFTTFVDPKVAAIFKEDISGSFEGIGAMVRMREDGRLEIVEPFEGQPAFEAGLRAGDIILEVDGTPIKNMTIMEAVALIRGPKGTPVHLKVMREGLKEPFEVTIIRQRIEIPIIETKWLDEDIAYVRLREFNAVAPDKLRDTLREMLARNPRGLIFDLRGNPGGLLSSAVDVGSLFLPKDTVLLLERFRDGTEQRYTTRGRPVALDIPLVVLVNGATASASEIVAGAIQDHGRGVLIGEKTFGKGSVQMPNTLSDGSELRVTIARWFTPEGRAIHGEGLEPDIVVEMTPEDVDAGRDPQLDRAVKYLQEGQ